MNKSLYSYNKYMYALHYLFLHSGQVLSSFKCYFKRKYLNLIDSNCDVDESCARGFLSGLSLPQALNVLSIYRVYKKKR